MVSLRSSKSLVVGAASLAMALTMAGCGSSKPSAPSTSSSSASTSGSSSSAPATSGSSSSAGGVDSAAAALVPSAIKSSGKLKIAADATYAPNEFVDDTGKIVGFDVDLGNAIAAKLGLTADVTNITFDDVLAGVQSGKFDLGMSSITDNKDREGKGYDLVTYFTAGTKVMVAKGNPKNITSTGPDDLSLCGLKVGVESTTIQETDDIPHRNDLCKKAGKPTITPVSQQKQTDVNTSLQSGRVDAVLADSPVVDYYAKNGPFQAVGDSYESAPYGIAIWKQTNHSLSQAVLAAIKDLQADGTYKQLTDKWGISSGSYTNVGINQATS